MTPVWITLSTLNLPPKSHLDAGQITGSHTLKSTLQSEGDMKSEHLPCSPPNEIPDLKLFFPIFIFSCPYCLAASEIACWARLIKVLDCPSLIPGKFKSAVFPL